MAAIPVSSDQMPTSTLQPRVTDEVADINRRLTILERLGALEARIAALEEAVFGP